MTSSDYRLPIRHRPPRYFDSDGNRILITRLTHKQRGNWGEEPIVARIIANMHIAGCWFSSLMPNLYLELGLHSGCMMSMSVPSKCIASDLVYPGDIDILVIPYENNELLLSRTLAVEIKILRTEKRRPGKSPNKFGYSQAKALLARGFPYVGVGHILVTDGPMDERSKEMLVAHMGSSSIDIISQTKIDSFEIDMRERALGRLKQGLGEERIGYFAMNFDGRRVFEPFGMSCERSAACDNELLKSIGVFYESNYQTFFELPRHSDFDTKYWERCLQEDPSVVAPWEFRRKLLGGKRILTTEAWLVQVDGKRLVAHHYSTGDEGFLFLEDGRSPFPPTTAFRTSRGTVTN